jgi:1-acyl-sn-glycerol-3-phosphate acyltransferase
MLRRLRDWFFTIPFLLALGLTLVAFHVAGLVALRMGPRPFEHVMARLQWTLMHLFTITGTELIVEKSEAIEPGRGYVIISNHQSMFDIAVIGGVMLTNYPKYVAKTELAKWIPSVSLNLREGGNALIDRKDRHQAIAAIVEMAELAQERDVSVVIFPEGTRSRDGTLGRFNRGGMKALLSAADKLDVIPVVIDGSWKLLRYNLRPIPFGTKVRLRLGDPIARTLGDQGVMVDKSETWIRDTLAEWRLANAET